MPSWVPGTIEKTSKPRVSVATPQEPSDAIVTTVQEFSIAGAAGWAWARCVKAPRPAAIALVGSRVGPLMRFGADERGCFGVDESLEDHLHTRADQVDVAAGADRVEQLGQVKLVEGHRVGLLVFLGRFTQRLTRWPTSTVDPVRTYTTPGDVTTYDSAYRDLNTPARPPACQSACQSTSAGRHPHALSRAGCHTVSAVVSASGRSSQHLAKVRVAGSNPVVRSTKPQVRGLSGGL